MRGGWIHLRVRICIWIARCGNIAANQGTIPEYACKNKASRGEGVLDAPFKLVGQVASSSRGMKTADKENSGHLETGGWLAVEVVGVEVVVVESKTLDVLVFRADRIQTTVMAEIQMDASMTQRLGLCLVTLTKKILLDTIQV